MLLDECRSMVASFARIVEVVKDDLRVTDPHEVRRTALALARDLIVRHGLVPGDFIAGGHFDYQSLPIKCVLDLIADRWSRLGRDPTRVYEVIHFTAPAVKE